MLELLGLQIFEPTGDIEDLGEEHGHRVLQVRGKGDKVVLVRGPQPSAAPFERAMDQRTAGPILLTCRGTGMDWHGATRRLRRLAEQAGVTLPRMHPHTLRHTFVTTMLDAGVDLQEVQIAARNADPRITMRYDPSPQGPRPPSHLHPRRLYGLRHLRQLSSCADGSACAPASQSEPSIRPQPHAYRGTCEDSSVIEVDLPDTEAVPELVRSFAACVASVTETPLSDVPQPCADFRGAIAHWRSWLAGRGAGLVPIAKAARFNWPGYWLAVLGHMGGAERPVDDGSAVLMFGTPSGVVLSPQDPALLGAAATDLPVRAGYVVSGFDPAFPTPISPLPRLRGRVEAIAVAEHATGPMRHVDQARARAGRGLDGDRYAAKAGTFTPANDTARGYDLTLIEAEVLDELVLPGGGKLGYAEARRNIVTRGVDLNALVGRRFRVGDVECLGQRLCEPCSHLERLTAKGVLRGLIHRGGLRADVLTDGQITTGAVIETTD